MNKLILFTLLLSTYISFAQKNVIKNEIGIQAGYNNGVGLRGHYTYFNFVKEVPMHIRLGIGYTTNNPGVSSDVRKIFINNATNGTPEKKGKNFDARMDFLFPIEILNNSFFNFGARYSSFKGNFKYIGGNEDFDITSTHFGIGAGVGSFFNINSKFNLEFNLGIDYFLPSTLTGHDTSYSPDDENINPQQDNQNNNINFIYKDADKAVNQPKLNPYLMLGVNYEL